MDLASGDRRRSDASGGSTASAGDRAIAAGSVTCDHAATCRVGDDCRASGVDADDPDQAEMACAASPASFALPGAIGNPARNPGDHHRPWAHWGGDGGEPASAD
jgi:hypothetical protein